MKSDRGDLGAGRLSLTNRFDLAQGKVLLSTAEFITNIADKLRDAETQIHDQAAGYRSRRTHHDIANFGEFTEFFGNSAGFVHAKWCGEYGSGG